MEVHIREIFQTWGSDDEKLIHNVEQLAAELGAAVYQETLRQLTAKTFAPETARLHWQRMLQHRDLLFPGERPSNRLRPALLDYLHSVAKEMHDPRIVEAGHLDNIHQASITDGLTGLYHQTYFKAHLDNLARTLEKTENNRFAVVIFDLDHFKEYNDRCGHLAGDQALKRTAELLQNNLRQGDLAGRYGGEEFVLLLRQTNLHDAYKLAENFRRRIECTVFPGQDLMTRGNLTISGGIAVWPDNGNSAVALLARADEELYQAKVQRNAINPNQNGQRREIRHPLLSLVEFSLAPERPYQPGLSFDISQTGLSFGCSPEDIPPGTNILMRLKKPFWPTDCELCGTVRNIQTRGEDGLMRVGLEFIATSENLQILLPKATNAVHRQQSFPLPPPACFSAS